MPCGSSYPTKAASCQVVGRGGIRHRRHHHHHQAEKSLRPVKRVWTDVKQQGGEESFRQKERGVTNTMVRDDAVLLKRDFGRTFLNHELLSPTCDAPLASLTNWISVVDAAMVYCTP
eukprot:scaffold3028_cov174-Amphora_coffeaeformis.AAC.6